MKVAAVIAEYNPFHNGHLYHLNETRRSGATHIVAIMSGSFTQRGEPAVFSKYTRASAAVKNGVDLVLELPVRYSLSSAQHFAEGAVSLVKGIGCVDLLSFGCECDNLDDLIYGASVSGREDIISHAKELYKNGLRYPDALSAALCEKGFYSISEILSKPNNLLAVEYLKALDSCSIMPLAVKRSGSGHDSLQLSDFPSASLIRSMIYKNKDFYPYVPENTREIYENSIMNNRYYLNSSLDLPMLFRLRMMSRKQFEEITDCSDGLGDRIYSASRTAVSAENVVKKASTKRYTVSRIRRALMNAFIGIECNSFPPVPYARILAIGPGGQDILKIMKSTAGIPVSGSFKTLLGSSEPLVQNILYEEERASNILGLLMADVSPCGADYTEKIIKEV